MPASSVLSALAFGCDGWGPGSGWGWPWGPIVLLAWVVVVATVAWFVVRSSRPGERSGVDRARDVLAERYARGELTTDEYRERLERLR